MIKIFDDYVLHRMNQKGLKSGISTYIINAQHLLEEDVRYTTEILKPIKNRTLYYFLLSIKLLSFGNYLIVFPFGYVPFGFWRRFHLVVHDVRNFVNNDIMSRLKQVYWLVSWRRSSRIIAVSDFTKDSVLEIYESEKVKRVYCPIDNLSRTQENNFREGWLYVGHLEKRKNVEHLLMLFAENELNLTVVGKLFDDSHTLSELLNLPNINYLGVVDEEVLSKLYHSHKYFINLSKYEGFSYTPYEAWKSGMELVLSDIPVHREIYSTVASLVDPNIEIIVHPDKSSTCVLNIDDDINEIFR